MFARRFVALLLVGFAGFGLVVAALGIYGVISYAVNQRRQEIGIRMALGASGAGVRLQVLADTLKLTGTGLVLGMSAAWLLGRSMGSLLFGVTPADPLAFTLALTVLVGVAVLAAYLPARRAARLDPMTALRAE
ncbi:MAG: FtsX-like permease family protein [Vicinamibacterales bacterium]|nr:FtsX-like permease family protein [Vicinamibacterales bacterium]MDP6608860.1 FtsX-like permease family protein [Vicinamibacterales bacterium]